MMNEPDMGTGIRAEVKVTSPDSCPIAQVAGGANTESVAISKSVNPDSPSLVTEEFLMEDPIVETHSQFERVFSYGKKRAYRFTRDLGQGCPCELVEGYDCPVIDVHTNDGDLHLVFHAPDMEVLQAVIAALKSDFEGID
ncbi:MAG: DNA-binding protein, partial [Halobacteriales archaeon]|nr:DNA-binding protein [Halobacteriales archaeon]